MTPRDGHVRVLPLHVANKIAAGEVVERPASVAKELVENAIDAGSKSIRISICQGGRKLVSVQDDGVGMTRDDALLSLERQATSKILDVDDIEEIDTLGFRGEAIPSIAAVSRFTIKTRRHDSDEGTEIQVNAGVLANTGAAGCPPGTLVEVRDLFCNIPARRKFLRSYATEEGHVKNIFTVHALAHPEIAFSLTVDGRELYRLTPTESLKDRIADLFGRELMDSLLPLEENGPVSIVGFIERPNLNLPTRRDQYVFINGRPASAPSITRAVRDAYPRRQGEVKPALFLFITVPPKDVDVNVHPTKREVRFRDNLAVKHAVESAIAKSIAGGWKSAEEPALSCPTVASAPIESPFVVAEAAPDTPNTAKVAAEIIERTLPSYEPMPSKPIKVESVPTQVEFAVEPDSTKSRPWQWFKFLAQTASGYVIIETDAGVVTINPHAARERIAFEQLRGRDHDSPPTIQSLLIPETIKLSPTDAARISSSLETINSMGFRIEPFGRDTFKIDAVPQLIGSLSPETVIITIARDLAEAGSRRGGEKWREDLIATSIARSFAGMAMELNEKLAVKLVEELAACRMPYVCPRNKPIMIFTSNRELDRKFARD